MNRDNAKIISDDALYCKVFRYESSRADNRYFRQRIIDFLKNAEGKTFSQFMFHAVWERNEQGKTLKYCHFNEHTQRVSLDSYFYEWMRRALIRAERELETINQLSTTKH